MITPVFDERDCSATEAPLDTALPLRHFFNTLANPIRERIRDVKRDQAARGLFLGGTRPPFGWTICSDETGKHLVHEPDEQTTFALMRKWRGKGSSYATIAADIAQAYPDARRLSAMAIKRILDRSSPPDHAA